MYFMVEKTKNTKKTKMQKMSTSKSSLSSSQYQSKKETQVKNKRTSSISPKMKEKNVPQKEKFSKAKPKKVSSDLSQQDIYKKISISAHPISDVGDPGFLGNDDVFDETDYAQWQQIRELADIQSRALTLNQPERHPDFDGKTCIECGEDIPEARLRMHKIRCIDCQEELEKFNKRHQVSFKNSSILD